VWENNIYTRYNIATTLGFNFEHRLRSILCCVILLLQRHVVKQTWEEKKQADYINTKRCYSPTVTGRKNCVQTWKNACLNWGSCLHRAASIGLIWDNLLPSKVALSDVYKFNLKLLSVAFVYSAIAPCMCILLNCWFANYHRLTSPSQYTNWTWTWFPL
jgi:hypothetical protein